MSQSSIRLTPVARPVDRMIAPEPVRVSQRSDFGDLADALAPLSRAVSEISNRRTVADQQTLESEQVAYIDQEAARLKNVDGYAAAVKEGKLKYTDVPWVQIDLKNQVSIGQAEENLLGAMNEYHSGVMSKEDNPEKVREWLHGKMIDGIDENDPYVAAAVAPYIRQRAAQVAMQHSEGRSRARGVEYRESISNNVANLAGTGDAVATGQLLDNILAPTGPFMPAAERIAAIMEGAQVYVDSTGDIEHMRGILEQLTVPSPSGELVPLLSTAAGKEGLMRLQERALNREARDVQLGARRDQERVDGELKGLLGLFDAHVAAGGDPDPLAFKIPEGTSREVLKAFNRQVLGEAQTDRALGEFNKDRQTSEAHSLLVSGQSGGMSTEESLNQQTKDGRRVRDVLAYNSAGSSVGQSLLAAQPISPEEEIALHVATQDGSTDVAQMDALKGRMDPSTWQYLRNQRVNNALGGSGGQQGISRGGSSGSAGSGPLDTLEISIKAGQDSLPETQDPMFDRDAHNRRLALIVSRAQLALAREIQAIDGDRTKTRSQKATAKEEALWRVSGQWGGYKDQASLLTAPVKAPEPEAKPPDPTVPLPVDPLDIREQEDILDSTGQYGPPDPEEVADAKQKLSEMTAGSRSRDGRLMSFMGRPLYDTSGIGGSHKEIPMRVFGSQQVSAVWEVLNDDMTDKQKESIKLLLIRGRYPPARRAVQTIGYLTIPMGGYRMAQKAAQETGYLSLFKDEEDLVRNARSVALRVGMTGTESAEFFESQRINLEMSRLKAHNTNGINTGRNNPAKHWPDR